MTEQTKSYSVLVCEKEEEDVLTQIQQILQLINWQIVGIAASAEEAVQQAQTHKPDIVVMALTLELERDGLTATRRIRTLCPTAVVLLSENTDQEIVTAGIEAGACALIEEPLELVKFVVCLIEARSRFERLELEIVFTKKLKGINLDRGLDNIEELSGSELQRKVGDKSRKSKKIEFIH